MKEYKVMATVPKENIIWDISTEVVVHSSSVCYEHLSAEIDTDEWKKSFFNLYNMWLNEEDDAVYNIWHEVNMSMVRALAKINKEADFKIYYWFEVDRDKYPDFVWIKCPLTGTDLIDLPAYYSKNNRKIAVGNPLVFPGL